MSNLSALSGGEVIELATTSARRIIETGDPNVIHDESNSYGRITEWLIERESDNGADLTKNIVHARIISVMLGRCYSP